MYHKDHITFRKGNIALTKVVADLTEKGYDVLLPMCEQLPFDLVVHKQGRFLRLQVKYSSPKKKGGGHTVCNRKYQPWLNSSTVYPLDVFDYYAVYLSDVNKIIYPSIKMGGLTIRTTVPNAPAPYHWYENFFEFTDDLPKSIINSSVTRSSCHAISKLSKLDRDELLTLVWSKPQEKIRSEMKVSVTSIKEYCKALGIDTPKRNYWILRGDGYSHEEAISYQPPIRSKRRLLTDAQVSSVLEQVRGGKKIRELGRQFGVPHTTILAIRDGESYKHVSRDGAPTPSRTETSR